MPSSQTKDAEGGRARLTRARAALRAGHPAVLVDAQAGRADLVAAADDVTAETINFLVGEGRGLVCLALAPERVRRLRLPPMAPGWDGAATAFTVSVEAASGVGTGISAADRAHTIRTAAAPEARPTDLVSPGHVFPLRTRAGGLLGGGGRAEAALELVRLAGAQGGAVLTEILDDAGELAQVPYARALARRFGLAVVTTDEIAHELRAAALHRLEADGASPGWRRGLALPSQDPPDVSASEEIPCP